MSRRRAGSHHPAEERARTLQTTCEAALGHTCVDRRKGAEECPSCRLATHLEKRPAFERAQLYGALNHGLALKRASELLLPDWVRDRDRMIRVARERLRKLLRHMMKNPNGRSLGFEAMIRLLVEWLLDQARSFDKIGSPDEEPFDAYMERMNARDEALRKGLREVFVRCLQRPKDFRALCVDVLLNGKPLKPVRRSTQTRSRSPRKAKPSVARPGATRGGKRPGAGRPVGEARAQTLRQLRTAGETKKSAEWLVEIAGLTKTRA